MSLNNSNINDAVNSWIAGSAARAWVEDKYGHISKWDVTGVTNMSKLFGFNATEGGLEWLSKVKFNEDISQWNTINVTNMSEMFHKNTEFNQPIGSWNVSNVDDMSSMFQEAKAFNQDISSWKVKPNCKTALVVYESGLSRFNKYKMTLDTSWNQNVEFYKYNISLFRDNELPTTSDFLVYYKKNLSSYKFELGDFPFLDKDNSDTLYKIQIVSLPSKGSLKLNSNNITVNQEIFATDISNNKLSYYTDELGSDTNTSFTFKVSDGSHYSEISICTINIIYPLKDNNIKQVVNDWVTNTNKNIIDASYGNISYWDVSEITNMKNLFKNTSFNEDISRWDVSKVTDMSSMFYQAKSFNQPIGDWNVSKVNDMSSMFYQAESFNQPIGDWNVSNVYNMSAMFYNAVSFNQDISKWKISLVVNMSDIFYNVGLNNLNKHKLTDNIPASYSWDKPTWAYHDYFSNNYLDNFKNKNPPTTSDSAVYIRYNVFRNFEYIFELKDFPFFDNDAGDILYKIQIISLPDWGELRLNNNKITVNQVISRADTLKYYRDDEGINDTSFNFKVFDGVNYSEEKTCTINFLEPLTDNNIKQAVKGWLTDTSKNIVKSTYGDISNWYTVDVTNMDNLFKDTSFNENISNWNVSKVESMKGMFYNAVSFNQDISNWWVSNVWWMNDMFHNAVSFDQNIFNWPVHALCSLENTFTNVGLSAYNKNMIANGAWWLDNTEFKNYWEPSFRTTDGNPTSSTGTTDGNPTSSTDMTYYAKFSVILSKNQLPYKFRLIDFKPDHSPIVDNVEYIRILSLPSKGILRLNNNNVNINQDISAAEIINNKFWYYADTSINTSIEKSIHINFNFKRFSEAHPDGRDESFKFFIFDKIPLMDLTINQAVINWITDPSSAIVNYGHISNWDVKDVTNMSYLFDGEFGEASLNYFNEDISNWNVSKVTNMSTMFRGAINFNQDISKWNVINVTNMSSMFEGAINFDQDISNWNTSKVTDMSYMFSRAIKFNQSIDTYSNLIPGPGGQPYKPWDVSKVTKMPNMFNEALSFNQPIGGWNVSKVTNMDWMFFDAASFNQPINTNGSQWNVSNVTNMSQMFKNAGKFNQPIGGWDVSDVTKADEMFNGALSFNQDISNWNFDSVTNIKNIFEDTMPLPYMPDFNLESRFKKSITIDNTLIRLAVEVWIKGPTHPDYNYLRNNLGHISDWDVSEVTDMNALFESATEFNEDISNWEVGKVTDMEDMFHGAMSFNQDISNWDTRKVTTMSSMFNSAFNFNQPINTSGNYWNVSNVTSMEFMFGQAIKFNQPIGKWDTTSVTGMDGMFSSALKFNQPINTSGNSWNVSSVTSMSDMFSNASSFNQDLSNWNISNVSDMSNMFEGASNFDQDISMWNFSNYPNMKGLFNDKSKASYENILKDVILGVSNIDPINDKNIHVIVVFWLEGSIAQKNLIINTLGNISDWDVSEVTNMESLFAGMSSFNEDISEWDTSEVTNMEKMFEGAINFNQSIGEWDTSKVTNMREMFSDATSFNKPIGNWDTSKVINMQGMFNNATNFNQPLDEWDVINVCNMGQMFSNAHKFNQPIGNWELNMLQKAPMMFAFAKKFNQPIDNWNVNKLHDVNGMFVGTEEFNQPIHNWELPTYLTDTTLMFAGAKKFNQNINDWDLKVFNMNFMFMDTLEFNQPLDEWDVSKVRSFDFVFCNAIKFNSEIGTWNTENGISFTSMFNNSKTIILDILETVLFTRDISVIINIIADPTKITINNKTYNVTFNSSEQDKILQLKNIFTSNINDSIEILINKIIIPSNYSSSFNQDISSWNVSSANNINNMFKNANNFNQNISGWKVKPDCSLVDTFTKVGLSRDNKHKMTVDTSWNLNADFKRLWLSTFTLSIITGNTKFIYGDTSDIYGNVSDLSGNIEYLEGFVGNIKGTIIFDNIKQQFLEGNVSDISGDISKIYANATNISGDVSDISGYVSDISGNVSFISGDVSYLDGFVGDLSGNINELSGNVVDLKNNGIFVKNSNSIWEVVPKTNDTTQIARPVSTNTGTVASTVTTYYTGGILNTGGSGFKNTNSGTIKTNGRTITNNK